jgi:cytochrome c-type biogenesis protein CcmH
MKEQAKDLLRAGYSERQVLAYFEDSYGEFVRLEPKAEGFNLLVWVAPALILLGGAVLIGLRFRRRSTLEPAPSVEPVATAEDSDQDPYLKKLREEIRRS